MTRAGKRKSWPTCCRGPSCIAGGHAIASAASMPKHPEEVTPSGGPKITTSILPEGRACASTGRPTPRNRHDPPYYDSPHRQSGGCVAKGSQAEAIFAHEPRPGNVYRGRGSTRRFRCTGAFWGGNPEGSCGEISIPGFMSDFWRKKKENCGLNHNGGTGRLARPAGRRDGPALTCTPRPRQAASITVISEL